MNQSDCYLLGAYYIHQTFFSTYVYVYPYPGSSPVPRLFTWERAQGYQGSWNETRHKANQPCVYNFSMDISMCVSSCWLSHTACSDGCRICSWFYRDLPKMLQMFTKSVLLLITAFNVSEIWPFYRLHLVCLVKQWNLCSFFSTAKLVLVQSCVEGLGRSLGGFHWKKHTATANSPVTTISSQGVGESRFHVSTEFPDTAVRNRLSVSLQQYHCCSLLEREYTIQ